MKDVDQEDAAILVQGVRDTDRQPDADAEINQLSGDFNVHNQPPWEN